MQKIIAHITDTHIDDPTALTRGINPRQNLGLLLEDLAQRKPDELVFTGDAGIPGSYGWLFDKMAEYQPNFRLTLGNHDDYSEAMQFYSGKTVGDGELYYTTEDDFYKYFYLDSSSGSLSTAQLSWLEGELHTTRKVVIFVHHPILGFATGMDSRYPLTNRDSVVALLSESRKDITVFCGHYHMPDKRKQNNITQYITPAVSFQVRKASSEIDIFTQHFGYRLITLTETRISTELILNFYDRFTSKRG